jgi:septal ring factor EnvC (AmiA/AmiB activator)
VKRLIPLLLFLTVLCKPSQPACTVVRTEPATKQDQIDQIEEDLSREKEQFLKFGEKEKELLKDLTLLEKEIEEKKQNLKDLEEGVTRIKKELSEGQAKLAQLENALSEVEARLGRRLDAFYRYAKRGYVRLLATSKGLDVLRKRIKYLKAIMRDDLSLMNTMAGLQQKYRQEISGVKDKLLELDRLEKAESSRMVALKEDIDRRVVLLMKIHKEKEFYQTAVKELELAAQNLKETLLNLDKKGDGKPLPPLPSNFEESRGKLQLPLNGKIIRDQSPSSQNGSKGIFFEAPSGAEVRAVFPGRVDFSGALKGYGQVIVINHGSRYFTVSAQLARRYKEAGESVKAGDVIGSLAEIKSGERSRLYFEIRQGAGNLDPLKWLKVH